MKRALVFMFLASFAAGMLVSVAPTAISIQRFETPNGPVFVWDVAEMQELRAVLNALRGQNAQLEQELREQKARYDKLEGQCI